MKLCKTIYYLYNYPGNNEYRASSIFLHAKFFLKAYPKCNYYSIPKHPPNPNQSDITNETSNTGVLAIPAMNVEMAFVNDPPIHLCIYYCAVSTLAARQCVNSWSIFVSSDADE